MEILIIKIVFLLLCVWFTIINVGMAYYKTQIPAINLFLQAVGITGFIVVQFLI